MDEQLELFDFDYAEQRWISYLDNWKEFNDDNSK